MKIAFFDTKPYDKIAFDAVSKEMGYEITYFEERLTPATADKAKGFDATCSFVNDEVTADVVQTLKDGGIQVMLLRCAGFDSVDLAKTKELGIPVLRVPAYSPDSVAEHAIALLQTVNRNTHLGSNRTKEFNFNINGLMGIALVGKTAGVIGTGKIGKCAVNLLRGFGMKVIAYDAFPDKSSDIEYVTLDELYAKSDVITLHCPLFPETKHMINKDSIAKMKDGVIILNNSRGPLIEEQDLADALNSGKIYAAGLDVVSTEPIKGDNPLLKAKNCFITPHISWAAQASRQRIMDITADNIKAFLEGSPVNIVNKQ